MSLERTIRDTVIAESQDLDGRLQQLVRAGLMPANTIPILRKAIVKVQGGMTLQGAERDVMANFINSMMFIVLGDDAIFNRARAGAKTYATEAKEKTEYDYEGDMAMGQLKSIIANSQRMHDMLSDDTNLPEWVQSKITLAEDYISTASNYMQGEMNEEKMPFKGPYRKAGERKDKYGNPIKNVAKHLAKKAMKAGANLKMDPDTGTPDHFTAAMRRKKGLPEDVELEEKRGLWDNIHAKRKRIKAGSGERMRKPGSEGAPSAADLKNSRTEEVEQVTEATYFVHTGINAHHVNKKIPTGKKDAGGQALMTSKVIKSFPYGDTQSKQTSPDQHKAAHAYAKKLNAGMKEDVEQIDEISSDMAHRYLKGKHERDYDTSADGKSSKTKKPQSFSKMNKDMISTARALKRIEKSKKLTKEDIEAVKSMHESYKNTFDAALEHYNIKSPSELGEDKRKEFFNHVDQKFKKGDN